jgi:putative membrane protein
MLLKKNIPIKYVLGKIKYELVFTVIYASVIGYLDASLHLENISVSTGVPTILGTIISLLLAFRSNQAYDRWWEARVIWGAIVNDSRTLSRLVSSFINDPEFSVEKHSFKEKFIKRHIAWCYCLGDSLRNQVSLARIKPFLSEKELEYVSKHDNKPNALLYLHSQDIHFSLEKGWINAYQQVKIEHIITNLCDSMGKCERIKNTIFPTTYSMYINFTLWIFIILFPFALTSYFGLFEIPLMIAITSALLLVEKMAIHLQDPFENRPTDIPVTALANTIEKNLMQILSDDSTTSKAHIESFYVL